MIPAYHLEAYFVHSFLMCHALLLHRRSKTLNLVYTYNAHYNIYTPQEEIHYCRSLILFEDSNAF
uniref:Uncharacterized protein n=1 Tax=Setaria italica TaxID=4555 RepID=K3Y4K6_SETIT